MASFGCGGILDGKVDGVSDGSGTGGWVGFYLDGFLFRAVDEFACAVEADLHEQIGAGVVDESADEEAFAGAHLAESGGAEGGAVFIVIFAVAGKVGEDEAVF